MKRRTRRCGCGVRIESLEARQLLVAAGTLDVSFSGDGKTTIASVGETLIATDVAVQADGKTVVVGRSETPGLTQFAVARFNLDGSLDTSFGPGGLVRSPFGDLNSSFATAVAMAPDGKIVVVGTAGVSAGFDEEELCVARYLPNGTLDNSFEDNGALVRDLSEGDADTNGEDVSVQLDGRIIVVGRRFSLGDVDFFVHALSVSGEDEGTIFPGFGATDTAIAVKQDGQNRVYVVGHVDDFDDGFARHVGLERITLDGLDSSGDFHKHFSLPGRTVTSVEDLVLLSGGKFVIAGHSVSLDGLNDFFIARFNANGDPDPTFGTTGSGFTVTNLGGDDVVGGLVISPSGGGFIVSGRSGGSMAAVKYNDNGAVDTTFGTGGIVKLTGFGGIANIARGPGRRVVLAGGNAFSTARLLLSGANLVTVSPFDSTASEGKVDPALFVVRRNEILPTATRVFFSIGGTAVGRVPALPGTLDYSLDKLIQPIATFGQPAGTPYVDILPGEQFAFVTLTTLNDSRVEGTETAIFTILSNANYELGAPASVTINIKDDDVLSFVVGITTVAPLPKQVDVGQEVLAAVTWTVPDGGWRQLSTIELRLRDKHDDDKLILLRFDEATNSFSLEQSSAVRGVPITLIPEKSTFQAAGPTAPTVTVTFAFRFNNSSAGDQYMVDVAADNDAGDQSGFSQIAKIHVQKHKKSLRDLLEDWDFWD